MKEKHNAPNIRGSLLKGVRLDCAGAGEVSRIEVEDSPLALEIIQTDVLAPVEEEEA